MTIEFWATMASVGTFIVITVTAIAAVYQLRHMQSANKITAIQNFFEGMEGPEMHDAFHFVRVELKQRLQDPAFRRELRAGKTDRAKHPEVQVCNFFDQWGLYYRDGAIDRRSFMRVNAGVVDGFWRLLEDAMALIADPKHGNVSFQDFEYLTVEARRWLAEHPTGDFPTDRERIPLVDRWRDEDTVE